MNITVLNAQGNKHEELTLNEAVFGIIPNFEAIKQFLRVFQANQRQGTSSTKTKAEVSGGGKKPWNQKGTGRARVGSIRSPIWVHGGVAHGPKPKNWGLNIPVKVKALALKSALSQKMSGESVLVLDDSFLTATKTKEMAVLFEQLKVKTPALLVVDSPAVEISRSLRNLKGLTVINTAALNAYELMKAKNVVFIKSALQNLEKKYENK